ncbi:Hypothetical Protein FCC1311_077042 [Hondaea fermentalgiana]|uniref:DUF2252 domain-containing protein n=1 Tax=Hondaea fermentalgiana TaxID=2315210 RepID=A0A2R5GKS4_9STRA|nr:Hypothetical Protein FCC1311_077042 [Hondaea fermentalgiana]|eukprot:GBG31480.1 Hypothetical Protein FCC1311_077042 [Hondaea fermentalgiana]
MYTRVGPTPPRRRSRALAWAAGAGAAVVFLCVVVARNGRGHEETVTVSPAEADIVGIGATLDMEMAMPSNTSDAALMDAVATDFYDGVEAYGAGDEDHNHTLSSRNNSLCAGWCANQYLPLVECTQHGLPRLRAAFQIENCAAALQGGKNLEAVNSKIEKIADNTAFVFFRGAAAFFDYNMMCSDPQFAAKRLTMPRVYSNGDCHPENFGVMVQANGDLVWGVNDFDQSFTTPFSWDVKRGATGFALGSVARAWADEDHSNAARAFVEAYVSTLVDHPNCEFANTERFIEHGRYVEGHASLIKDLFKKSRDRESKKETLHFLEDKMSIDLKNDRFIKTDKIHPVNESLIPEFQESVDAYLYHGVAALAKFPNDGKFYKVVAVARKEGSGTGSIGLNRFYLLIKGRYESQKHGYIILEMKEEVNSVLQVFFRYSYTASQEGKRAVDAERSAWPYTNLFYGWTTFRDKSYIIREKSKHNVDVNLEKLSKDEYIQYSSHGGRALALYHIRARCNNHECEPHAQSAVDKEICSQIQTYLHKNVGVQNFTNQVHQFAIEETNREIKAWKLLRSFVNPRRDTKTSYKLLNGGERPHSCS